MLGINLGITRNGAVFTLPQQALLFYTEIPNSDNLLDDEGLETDESLEDWGYALPLGLYAIFGDGSWFSDASTPITRSMGAILGDAATNIDMEFASARRGLAVYDPATITEATIARALRYFKPPAVPAGAITDELDGGIWDQTGDYIIGA